jgi:hypothetical protein
MKRFFFNCLYPLITIYVGVRFKSIWHLKVFLKRSKINLFILLLIRYYEAKLAKNNSWIGHNADIPYIPCFPHGISGIFISNGAKIGKNGLMRNSPWMPPPWLTKYQAATIHDWGKSITYAP